MKRSMWFSGALGLALVWAAMNPAGVAGQATGNIRGTVVQSPSGTPIASVQVALVGTQRGTITDRNGVYTLTAVPVGEYEIRAISIGYTTQTQTINVTANQVTTIDFQMTESILDIEELVVTGVAGETAIGRLPFTVERLTEASMPIPATDAGAMLQGKIAGAIVTSGSGLPGSTPSILLRGPTSIQASGRSQEPLYIVDGVILASGMQDIDAMDIESIEVVKGAAATTSSTAPRAS